MCFSEASKAAIGWRMNGFGELDWGAFSLDYDWLQLVNGAAVTHSSYSFSFLICKGFPDEWKQEKCFTQQFCTNLLSFKVILLYTSKSVTYLKNHPFFQWSVFPAHCYLFPVWWATGKPDCGQNSGAIFFLSKKSSNSQQSNPDSGNIFWRNLLASEKRIEWANLKL